MARRPSAALVTPVVHGSLSRVAAANSLKKSTYTIRMVGWIYYLPSISATFGLDSWVRPYLAGHVAGARARRATAGTRAARLATATASTAARRCGPSRPCSTASCRTSTSKYRVQSRGERNARREAECAARIIFCLESLFSTIQ